MNNSIETTDTGMELRDLLQDEAFAQRSKSSRSFQSEFDALRRLTQVFAESPRILLQELVDIAVENCGADSAGISLEEQDDAGNMRFRWVAVAGSFSQYLNGTTPRFFSPCGTCLSSGRPQLYTVTKPYYDFLGVVAEPIVDGMLIPWETDASDSGERMRGTIWAVSQASSEAFGPEDYRLLRSLADFVAIAIRHQFQQQALRQREREAAVADKANQLAHQINNPLQSLTNMLYIAREGKENWQSYIEDACQELESLSNLVRKLLSLKTEDCR
ncbi:MAG TPA: histidine kinase dimerization/phospho-acceptor domain-containing protein [Acidobacteriaceae bacterium]|jgi:signal transduction histidine kinase|nr:histidine kinase dimerization/phospho-acceptor domain-containing protein [Acidobacteriaceae bacterium]